MYYLAAPSVQTIQVLGGDDTHRVKHFNFATTDRYNISCAAFGGWPLPITIHLRSSLSKSELGTHQCYETRESCSIIVKEVRLSHREILECEAWAAETESKIKTNSSFASLSTMTMEYAKLELMLFPQFPRKSDTVTAICIVFIGTGNHNNSGISMTVSKLLPQQRQYVALNNDEWSETASTYDSTSSKSQEFRELHSKFWLSRRDRDLRTLSITSNNNYYVWHVSKIKLDFDTEADGLKVECRYANAARIAATSSRIHFSNYAFGFFVCKTSRLLSLICFLLSVCFHIVCMLHFIIILANLNLKVCIVLLSVVFFGLLLLLLQILFVNVVARDLEMPNRRSWMRNYPVMLQQSFRRCFLRQRRTAFL